MSNEVCHSGHTRWFHCWLLLSCKYSYICNYTQLNEGTSPQLYANIDQHCPSQPRPSAYCKGHVSAQQSSEAHKTLNIKTLWEKVGSLVNFVTPVGEGATSRSQRYKWAIRSKVTRHNMSHVPTEDREDKGLPSLGTNRWPMRSNYQLDMPCSGDDF